MYIGTGPLTSSPIIHRHPANPILTPADVPYEARLVFNAGVTRYQGKYVMVFRNDYGQRPDSVHPAATKLGLALSDDGVRWQVQPKPCWEWKDDEVSRVYDPRLTVMDGRCYMCFAVDTRHGVCGGQVTPTHALGRHTPSSQRPSLPQRALPQEGRHDPFLQYSPGLHATDAHGSATHLASRQTSPAGQPRP